MKKTDRHRQMLAQQLQSHARLRLADAIALLGVSESTARRLFRQMEEDGQVVRVHGGIQPVVQPDADYRYDLVEAHHAEEKQRIAAAAAALVRDGDVIFLDTGTTLGLMSRHLARRLAGGELSRITVFTNSLVNLHALCRQADVTLMGGSYRDNRKDFCGYVAEETLRGLHFSQCFLGTDGYDPTAGFTAMDFATARMNELVLGRSDVCVLLADASKFNRASTVSFSRRGPVHRLITDREPAPAVRDALLAAGTQIQIVSSEI